jgi:hypothetical protein
MVLPSGCEPGVKAPRMTWTPGTSSVAPNSGNARKTATIVRRKLIAAA